MNNKRFILSSGGTGGHIFPAVAIAKELVNRYGSNTEILFVGAIGKMEMTRIPAAGFAITGLPVEGLKRSLSPKNILVFAKALWSIVKARSIIKKFNPDAVIGTGGYVSLPVCLVASRMNIPVILQEQNGFAGLTNKTVGSKAAVVCTGFPAMEKFFPNGNWMFTGNPVREAIVETGSILANPETAYNYSANAAAKWGMNISKPIVFITGGSLGARTINETILENLESLLTKEIQIIWQTGERFWNSQSDSIQNSISALNSIGVTTPLHCSAFIDQMELAMAAATVIVSRAGAITLSEIALVGKPAVLVPSPNVTDDHQTKNAKVLTDASAAIAVADSDCSHSLIPAILDLLENPELQKSIQTQLKSLAKPSATKTIVDQIQLHLIAENL